MNTLMNIFSIGGAVAFAICALPQLIKCIVDKSTKAVSMWFILLSIMGNVMFGCYVFYSNMLRGASQIPVYANYGVALTIMLVLFVLKLRWK